MICWHKKEYQYHNVKDLLLILEQIPVTYCTFQRKEKSKEASSQMISLRTVTQWLSHTAYFMLLMFS